MQPCSSFMNLSHCAPPSTNTKSSMLCFLMKSMKVRTVRIRFLRGSRVQRDKMYFLFSGILYFDFALFICPMLAGLKLSSQASKAVVIFSGFKCAKCFKKSFLVCSEMAK